MWAFIAVMATKTHGMYLPRQGLPGSWMGLLFDIRYICQYIFRLALNIFLIAAILAGPLGLKSDRQAYLEKAHPISFL